MKSLIVFVVFTLIGIGIVATYTKKAPTQLKEGLKLPFIQKNQFSLENAPSDSLRAKIATLSGQVKWQDRVATQPSEIKGPEVIQQGEELTTGSDGKLELEIPSGVLITASPKTNIAFIQTLPQNIVLSQTTGKAQYQKTGTNPVSVRIDRLLVEIQSGQITISISETKLTTTIDIQAGTITVAYNDLQNVSNVRQIQSGKEFIFNNSTRQSLVN